MQWWVDRVVVCFRMVGGHCGVCGRCRGGVFGVNGHSCVCRTLCYGLWAGKCPTCELEPAQGQWLPPPCTHPHSPSPAPPMPSSSSSPQPAPTAPKSISSIAAAAAAAAAAPEVPLARSESAPHARGEEGEGRILSGCTISLLFDDSLLLLCFVFCGWLSGVCGQAPATKQPLACRHRILCHGLLPAINSGTST